MLPKLALKNLLRFYVIYIIQLKFEFFLYTCKTNRINDHLVKLNRAIPIHISDITGLNLSPITAALRSIPRNPLRCDYMNVGPIARMYEAVQIINRTTMIMLSKLKNALYVRFHLPSIDINIIYIMHYIIV